MTAMIDFQSSPRYQRIIQKISALRPEQRAILDSAVADEKFAGEAMQRHVRSFITAADLQNKSRALDIQEKGLGLRTNLANQTLGMENEALDFAQGQNQIGSLISAANIPISGYFGLKQMQRDTDEAEENRKHRRNIEALLASKGVK